MIEKVNPSHPDKVADRIAGAIVDLAYQIEHDPKIAVEVLIGHGKCHVIIETTAVLNTAAIAAVIRRIGGDVEPDIVIVPQDEHLSENQAAGLRCGDNGIFRGCPLNSEQRLLSAIAHVIYEKYTSDGKYILDGDRLIICQSNAPKQDLVEIYPDAEINPLGGGLHGKDLSKADVSVNIHAFLKAQKTGEPIELSCAIGDDTVDGLPYSEIVEEAREFIHSIGGFEAFAEWGLY